MASLELEPIASGLAPLLVDDERQAVVGWLLSKRSENTRAAYGRDLRRFLEWCELIGSTLATATPSTVEAWATFQLEEGQAATASVARRVAAVSSFYQWAAKAGRVFEGRTNPASPELIDRVKSSSVHTPALTLSETRRLIAAAESAKHSGRDLAVVLLLVSTGLRVSELIAADVEDLTNSAGTAMLKVHSGKGRKARSVALDPMVCDLVTREGRTAGPLVANLAGSRLTRAKVTKYLTRLARVAEIETVVTPHVLRASYITIGDELGARTEDLQANVGHGDPRQTQAYIRRNRTAQQQGALAAQVVAAVTS